MSEERKHSHYFKPCPFDHVDVYRVLVLFNVTDPCLQHAIKKLLLAGGRGAKAEAGWTADKDVGEALDSLRRWQEMRAEEASVPVPITWPTIDASALAEDPVRKTIAEWLNPINAAVNKSTGNPFGADWSINP